MRNKNNVKGKAELIKMENFLETENSLKIDDKIEKDSKTFEQIMFLYSVAIKEVVMKLDIMKEEFKLFYNYDLIDHVQTRIKTVDSIANKMKSRNLELTYQDMIENINDIAGIRVICPLKKDIFSVRNLIKEIPGARILKEKDYITKPKKSGYSSYHIIMEVPIIVLQKLMYVKVEIQIRTMAMDFWASLEHKMKYKSQKQVTKATSKELVACAKTIYKLDNKMMLLNE